MHAETSEHNSDPVCDKYESYRMAFLTRFIKLFLCPHKAVKGNGGNGSKLSAVAGSLKIIKRAKECNAFTGSKNRSLDTTGRNFVMR